MADQPWYAMGSTPLIGTDGAVDPRMGGLLALGASLLGNSRNGKGIGQNLGGGLLDAMQSQQFLAQNAAQQKRWATQEALAQQQMDLQNRQIARQDKQDARVDQQQAARTEALKGLPPELQGVAAGAPDEAFAAYLRQKMPEPMTAGQQASLAQAQAQFEASQQRQAEQFAAQMGMSKAELGLQQQRLAAEMGRGQSPDLVSIDDPNKPGQAIYVDKRTMQPVLGPDGQPARPASQREAGASFNQANTLRTAYQKNVKDAQDSATAYRKVENAFGQDTGAGDIAGIFGFMKSIDPTSTVREGEFATAQNAGGVPASVWNLYNRAMNGERLTPEVRKQILSTAGSQVKAYLPAYEQAGKNYTELATAAGVDPTQVVQPFDFPTFDAAPAPAPPQAAPAPAPALVPQATAGQPQPVDEYSLLFGMP